MYKEYKKNSSGYFGGNSGATRKKLSSWRKKKCTAPSIFIHKTYEILEDNYYGDVVRWNSDGTNFIITDIDRFEQEILPKYFRHKKFSSFVRQLNMYDFHKIRNEATKNVFYHREFRRNCVHLLRNIKRKGCTSRRRSYQPNQFFYSYEEDLLSCEHYLSHEDKQLDHQKTLESIEKIQHNEESYLLISAPTDKSYFTDKSYLSDKAYFAYRTSEGDRTARDELIEEFLRTLPETVHSEQEIKKIIEHMKGNPRYECLQKDVRTLIKRIRRDRLVREEEYLYDLSIEEYIMVENIDYRYLAEPNMYILTSELWLHGDKNAGDDMLNLSVY